MAVAVTAAMLGRALAVMTAVPGLTPVIGTLVDVPLAAKVAVAGTVATLVLFELRFTVKPPAGACVESVSARLAVAVPVIETVFGLKAMVALITCTD